MEKHKQEFERIANEILKQSCEAKGDENKPNYSNRDFMNCVIIFQTALMDKMYDLQHKEKLEFDDRLKMAESCGLQLRDLIKTFTGLDTHNVHDFI